MNTIKIPPSGARGLLLLLILGLGGLLFFKTSARIVDKKQIENNLQSLPKVLVSDLDSTQFSVSTWADNQAVIIFYFDTNCEHCQSEAQALKSQAEAFKEAKLLWLSVAQLAQLRAFEQKFDLEKTFGSALKIAQITPEAADKEFGFRVVPTILIYDGQQKLVKKYVGETKIETLRKYIVQP